jgi:hypothetical protein
LNLRAAAAYGYSNEREEIPVFALDGRNGKKAPKKAVEWWKKLLSWMQEALRLCLFLCSLLRRHTSATRAEASDGSVIGCLLRAITQALPANRSPRDLLGTELLYDEHGAATTGAAPGTIRQL